MLDFDVAYVRTPTGRPEAVGHSHRSPTGTLVQLVAVALSGTIYLQKCLLKHVHGTTVHELEMLSTRKAGDVVQGAREGLPRFMAIARTARLREEPLHQQRLPCVGHEPILPRGWITSAGIQEDSRLCVPRLP